MRNLAISALAGAVLAGAGSAAALDAATTTPALYLDYANIIATGQTIFLNRLPIRRSDGSFIYKDVTIQLQTDSTGLVSDISPIVQALSPSLSFTFKAGIYALTSNTGFGFALNGPSPVSGSVMTKWETTVTPTKNRAWCGFPSVFYVGPLSANPYAARIKAAGITSTEYSYGIVASDAYCGNVGNSFWGANALVGFSQSGSLLTIATFTDYLKKDHNLPQAFYTYRLQ